LPIFQETGKKIRYFPKTNLLAGQKMLFSYILIKEFRAGCSKIYKRTKKEG
jgi:hypothetical protein